MQTSYLDGTYRHFYFKRFKGIKWEKSSQLYTYFFCSGFRLGVFPMGLHVFWKYPIRNTSSCEYKCLMGSIIWGGIYESRRSWLKKKEGEEEKAGPFIGIDISIWLVCWKRSNGNKIYLFYAFLFRSNVSVSNSCEIDYTFYGIGTSESSCCILLSLWCLNWKCNYMYRKSVVREYAKIAISRSFVCFEI